TQLNASSEGIVESSGGSALGEGVSMALNGMVVTNLVLGAATAEIIGGAVTTGGALTVRATNDARLNALLNSVTTSGDEAVGLAASFNTLGYKAQDILSQGIDALLGTGFGIADKAEAVARITSTTLSVGGDLTISADNIAQLNATLSNAAKSQASALYGAGGSAAGFVLTSNLVAAGADARLTSPAENSTATGDVTISATDNAGIYANTKLVSSSVTTNTGGLDILRDTLDTASDLANAPQYYSSDALPTGSSGFPLTFGDRVQVQDDYSVDVDGETVDIPAGVYKYLGASGEFNPETTDYLDLDFWQAETSASGLIPDIGNISDSDAIAAGGMVVRNQVESGATALVTGTTLTAGSLSVAATESSTMIAELDSFVESSGGSNTGGGDSVATNGA
ncbi:hypothetical protein, partial [Spiribacter salilacus]|uniref:hypothetical protein n=1 Tax=Spiribacter salilacus TaxID=2664894 RepID=UPI001561F3F0